MGSLALGHSGLFVAARRLNLDVGFNPRWRKSDPRVASATVEAVAQSSGGYGFLQSSLTRRASRADRYVG
jgi:hypothetical protein